MKKSTKYILPAYWAVALINDDWSGMSESDTENCKKWLEKKQPGNCVGCSEHQYFAWRNDATDIGGDVLEYTFIN